MSIRSLVDEARSVGSTLTAERDTAPVGPIAVSGMLAEQLAKELAAGAEPGAVVVGGAELAGRAEVLVRVVAGDPSAEDDALVRAADARGVPVVVVQLWPQADWTAPYVLTPFVVECRAGEGFPLSDIADRVLESTEGSAVLASRAPVIADATRTGLVRRSVIRSALIGIAGSRYGASRPLLSLEQIRLLSQLRSIGTTSHASDELRARAVGAAGVVTAGFALRAAARSLRTVLPSPIVHAAVAAAGTWALAKAYQAAEAHLPDA
jgi:hypothetical protein